VLLQRRTPLQFAQEKKLDRLVEVLSAAAQH
jgi:hypothetical protein